MRNGGPLRTFYELRTGHWAWCCFTCQQAAEKALKALGEHFHHPLFGHNLNILLSALAAYVEIPPTIREACARLNRFYIPTRYPNAFDQGAPADQFFETDAAKPSRIQRR
ncbi:MAG: HEPN domain-containing protein [Thermoflexus sp.]